MFISSILISLTDVFVMVPLVNKDAPKGILSHLSYGMSIVLLLVVAYFMIYFLREVFDLFKG